MQKQLLLLLSLTAAFASCNNTSEVKVDKEVSMVHDSVLSKHTVLSKHNMVIDSTDTFTIYYPQYGRVDLACGSMPSPNNDSILMCCGAAFTGQLLDEFNHSNIAGNHTSNGVFHKGYRCKANTGCFAYFGDDGTWQFAINDYNKHVVEASERNGCAFGQVLLIHQGKLQPRAAQKQTSQNFYRVLAEYKGQLCIIDSKNKIVYKDFIDGLLNMGVTHALYLDMGTGWNYSYYRDNENTVHFIHNKKIKYTTNWITFYK